MIFKTRSKWLVVPALTAVAAAAIPALADSFIEILPVQAQTGMQVQIGQCPCFRWQVRAAAGVGKIETDTILISTDALFEYMQTTPANFATLASQEFKVGSIELIAKNSHLGIHFNGVQFGQNVDLGYASLLRTGGSILYSKILAAGLRLDVHGGFDWDSFAATTGISASRGLMEEAVSLHWDSGPWSAIINARLGQETDGNFFNFGRMVAGADANMRVRLKSFSDFELGLTGRVSVEHDGFRSDVLKLNADNAIASLLVDISWVERGGHPLDE